MGSGGIRRFPSSGVGVRNGRCRGLVTLLAVGVAALGGATSASAAQYRGAQTHPLWWDSSVHEFDRELDLLERAGSDVVRIDIVWSSLETDGAGTRSSWYVDKIDTFMQHAQSRGIKVVPTFHGTPCWASSAPQSLRQDCSGAWWDRGVTAYPPRDARDYARAAAWVAERWGDHMVGFEVWNEPNESSQHFWRTPDQAADYARLLKATYPALKAARPNLPVAAGALSFSDGAFTERLYELGVKGHFDVFSIHPYAEKEPPTHTAEGEYRKWSFASGVPWIRRIMLSHGDDKPLWLTEFGWTSCESKTDYGLRRCVTRQQQADYTRRAWEMIGEWSYVELATQYNLRNKGSDPLDIEHQYGLVHRDFTPKPAYQAFAESMSVGGSSGETIDSTVDLADPSATRLAPDGSIKARLACPSSAKTACRGELELYTAERVTWTGEPTRRRIARSEYAVRRGTREVIDLRLRYWPAERVASLGRLSVVAEARRDPGAGVPTIAPRSFWLTAN